MTIRNPAKIKKIEEEVVKPPKKDGEEEEEEDEEGEKKEGKPLVPVIEQPVEPVSDVDPSLVPFEIIDNDDGSYYIVFTVIILTREKVGD